MRTFSILVLTALACGASFAALRPETVTYVNGNLPGIAPNSGGTLLFSDETAMYLRTGSEIIAVPYAGISKAELGLTKANSHDTPLYKVWSLPKRVMGKTATQYLTVDFKTTEGEEKNITLELAKSSAKDVLFTIRSNKAQAAKPPFAAKSEWWGDEYWKTNRNRDLWNKPSTAGAP